eukprot:jgi/Undpi1/115/HiC_scaffold_1.g00115.m1
MRSSLAMKTIFFVSCFSMLHYTTTASAIRQAGLISGISARFRTGPSTTPTSEDPVERARLAEQERVKAVSAQCCAALHESDGVGEWADGVFKQKWPKICLIDGAKCPTYDFHGLEPEPTVPAEIMLCIDINGNTVPRRITADTANRSQTTTTDNFGAAFPPCDLSPIDQLRYEWCLFIGALGVAAVVQTMGTLYSAFLPLQHGDETRLDLENLTYEERLLVVATLWLACGGATIIFLVLQAYLVRCIWVLWFTWWVLIPAVLLMTSTAIAMRRLDHRMPDKAILGHRLFRLWREYFGFEVIYEDYDMLMKVLADEGQQYLLAQMPHAVMPFGAILGMSVAEIAFPGVWPVSAVVASALLSTPVLRNAINVLGVREAGTASILRMFADGFKAVCVVTGGIGEMFVSRKKEKLTCLRKNFAKIAFRGGYAIIPVYCFGVSRTHDLLPGVDNRYIRLLSRKLRLPLILFRGAFGLIPHRQKMKLLVGRPILVDKATSPVTDDEAQALCDKVQAAVIKLYNDHKPTWETRPISFEP